MPADTYRRKPVVLVAGGALVIILLLWLSPAHRSACNVAYIKLHGYLTTYVPDSQSASSTGAQDQTASDAVTGSIRAAIADPGMRAIVMEVDSPGGSPVAGEEIQAALKQSPKPTVALIRDSGDSAAYLSATGAGTIFASAFSDVGDIGITQSYVDNSRQNADNGLTYNQLSIGKYKDMFSTDKPLTPDERTLALKELQIDYERFVQIVSDNRHLSIAVVTALADGSSVTGSEAVQDGLIDKVGNIDDIRTYLQGKIGERAVVCGIDTH